MESLSSVPNIINSFESDLQSLTLQNNLQDIVTIIKKYQEGFSIENTKSKNKSSKKRKTVEKDIDLLVQDAIQRQIKNYIEKIESNLKKYWYTDMEAKLYAFLTDLKINWDFFEPFFQVDESFEYLEDTILAYVLDLKKQRSELEIDELLESISNTFEYWPFQKAHHCIELATFLERKKEIETSLLVIQRQLISYNIENMVNSELLKGLPKKFPLLQINDKNQNLLDLLQQKIVRVEQTENIEKIKSNFELLEEMIVRGGMWDQTVEQDILLKLNLLVPDQLTEIFKKFIAILNLYYSEFKKNNSILDTYPELSFQSKLVPINLTYEGVWSLQLLFKGIWIPAFRLKDHSDFSHVEFLQEGEWKNRKFKCFSWTLKGMIPIGVVLKLVNKKEVLFLITTQSVSNHVRDINLTLIDENLISQFSNGSKDIHQLSKRETKLINFEQLQFSTSILLKLSLKIISLDKNRVTKLSEALMTILSTKGAELRTLLDTNKDDKFIRFLDKIQRS